MHTYPQCKWTIPYKTFAIKINQQPAVIDVSLDESPRRPHVPTCMALKILPQPKPRHTAAKNRDDPTRGAQRPSAARRRYFARGRDRTDAAPDIPEHRSPCLQSGPAGQICLRRRARSPNSDEPAPAPRIREIPILLYVCRATRGLPFHDVAATLIRGLGENRKGYVSGAFWFGRQAFLRGILMRRDWLATGNNRWFPWRVLFWAGGWMSEITHGPIRLFTARAHFVFLRHRCAYKEMR